MKPQLVIMAAGLGSRYGGLKQIAPVDQEGHLIIDFSIFDAIQAGFERVICVIKREIEADFREAIGDRIAPFVDLQYAYQDLDNLPDGFVVPEDRTKPWGTAHALMCAKDALLDAPFVVINADDFYGRDAYQAIFTYLNTHHGAQDHCMVGFELQNTLSENGHVARGICHCDAEYQLIEVVEHVQIVPATGGGISVQENQEDLFIDAKTLVSMNCWGFQYAFIHEVEKHFASYLNEHLPTNPLKLEYFLPYVVNCALLEKVGTVHVLPTKDKWYGVTYQSDMPAVQAFITDAKEKGIYPNQLWRK